MNPPLSSEPTPLPSVDELAGRMQALCALRQQMLEMRARLETLHLILRLNRPLLPRR